MPPPSTSGPRAARFPVGQPSTGGRALARARRADLQRVPPKHRTILTTCYAVGLRISEAVRLTAPAIDSQRMVLRIALGKGQKDRYVMLSPQLLEILRARWKRTRPTHWLFPGAHPGRPISRSAVEQECQHARRRCRIPKPITPRHAFAVHLLETGTRLIVVINQGWGNFR